jgi:hypothetical protein
MSTHLNLTELRANLYQAIDHMIETGIPIEIDRKGHKVIINVQSSKSKFERLVKRKIVIGDEEDLVHFDWSPQWSEEKDLLK